MTYKENPKTRGSGLLCCIPQKDRCPMNCPDCFFQSGRSYLEPLEDNLPNMPTLEMVGHRILRVNDGNDSSVQKALVKDLTEIYPLKFYNTSFPEDLEDFRSPVVVTINPAELTNVGFHRIDPIPKNLMFVRVRTSMMNLYNVVDEAVDYYTECEIPIILTFMAYFDTEIPEIYKKYYMFRKRTLNNYWAITTEAWEKVMNRYKYNKWVYSCGKIEGEKGVTACRFCGNCIREFYVTLERMLK